jgi:hypothetical protein
MCFPYPPYCIIDIYRDAPRDVETYILEKTREVGIPNIKGDRIGVTIRVSLPGDLNKIAKHGGLHVTDEREILKRVLERYEQYGVQAKIIIQHTVDAKCSGTILKENDHAVVETILGDAPPLLDGLVSDYERWVFLLLAREWKKEKEYRFGGEEVSILSCEDLRTLERYIDLLPNHAYAEWSISKSGKIYFYEYYELERNA